ncbi:hypothetical protein EBBID32_27480 [Sphingobium indicum BiD32]|uniref:Uncharacterized protein n=1 Tax=Sphingobium indicum BiD32 TaxID=1301087 RepID=N1MMF9_9SPHN|nr:hypothetical protein EBBID32_27480 [Sphingobium indicum BiD32]
MQGHAHDVICHGKQRPGVDMIAVWPIAAAQCCGLPRNNAVWTHF